MNNTKILRNILVGILIFLILGLISFIIFIIVTKKDYEISEINFGTKEIEVYDEKKLTDFIDQNAYNIELEKDIKIDANKVKEETLEFFYKQDKKRYKASVDIAVVDTTKPRIFANSTYTLIEKSTTKLENYILSGDNYDNNPKREIIGDYDMNTPGTYQLTYKITDSSGNEAEQGFTLKVKKKYTGPVDSTPQPLRGTNFDYFIDNYKNDNTEIGIDVSKWQGNIDFEKVKNAGCSFVIIRVGHQKGIKGEYIIDPYFKKNIENAKKNDLKVGVYFYSYSDSPKESQKQVDWIYKQVKDYKLDLGISYDWESWTLFNQTNQSFHTFNETANSFLNQTKKYNMEGMLYGSKYYLNNIYTYNKKNIWLAHYTKQTDYKNLHRMWQLSSTGLIDGINTNVDINVLYKNI